MEDKKTLYLIIAAIIIVLILIGSFGLFFLLREQNVNDLNQAATNQATETNVNVGGFLSPTLGTLPKTGTETAAEKSAKEKQFISSYYQPIESNYQAKVPTYPLPLANLKETVTNYRDFSRKISLDASNDKLTENGFASLTNPFTETANDWQSAYTQLKENNLPLLITADSILGVYQDTTQVIYKEIEKDVFYPSLWHLLDGLFDVAKKRYEVKKQKFGIETNLTAEASRLELAYLTVALKLLQPDASQIKEVIGAEKEFFSPAEAETYSFKPPNYLDNEVNQEIVLIDKKTKVAKSAIFLYQKDYSPYQMPLEYQSSEKLKNYYLAVTWLNNNLFPLWSQADGCAECLVDEQDQPIHFLAGLYLTQDLAKNQTLKNRWANIYKSISFFRGLETNLTYLNYNQALEELYGVDYDLDQIFLTDLATAKTAIKKIQNAIASLTFPKLLGGSQDAKPAAGLRLLRNYYLPEDTIFTQLAGAEVGPYPEEIKENKDLPFTACRVEKQIQRCWPTSLDIFNLFQNQTAKNILTQTKNDRYQNYQSRLNELAAEVKKFDQNTWHDNAYLATLLTLQNLATDNLSGFPTFMQTESWAKKTLNTSLAALVDAKQEITLEKTGLKQIVGLKSYAGNYGYIEPQIKFYNQLLANVRMVKNGFTNLNIIAKTDKTFDRLTNLEAILEKTAKISQKELANETLAIDDYDFINDFDDKVKSVTGDIKKENLQNIYTQSFAVAEKNTFNQYLEGFNYLIVIYPDTDGKLFFAIGPILNYTEGKNQRKVPAAWQDF